jgi:hypothetical protein
MKIGKMYKKSLRDLLKGPMAVFSKRDITRYRNLEKLGLVSGVGIRVVSITKAGRAALNSGETIDPQTIPNVNHIYTSYRAVGDLVALALIRETSTTIYGDTYATPF